ncbi:MAG: potassium transporter TrkG [Bacillota bacterium]
MRKEQAGNKKGGVPPVLLIALTFIVLICIGTVLLMLPISNRSGAFFPLVSSLFTATSAVCVTGLTVVDTFTNFTFFGQLVILILIQCGGLGLMTIATLVFIFIGKRITLKDRLVLQEVYSDSNLTGLLKLTQGIIKLTFIMEFIGAMFLSLTFIPEYGFIQGAWVSVFHAISAFCNAGFDILGTGASLATYYSDPFVLLTIATLVIIGGLGFGVLFDIRRYLKKESLHLQQNSRCVIFMSLGLLLFGWIIFFIFEFNNPLTLGAMNFWDKIVNSFVQSVMPRTAGFATVNQGGLSHISQSVTEFLMFIGASPASTGGGIKTTTFLVIIMMFVAGSKGEDEVLLGNKKIAWRICMKALAIVFLGFIIISIVTTVIFAIELKLGNPAATLSNVMFEVTSAFGTVGLSTGITATLSNTSLIILACVMLVGRLGTLCLSLLFLASKGKTHLNIKHPNARIVIG